MSKTIKGQAWICDDKVFQTLTVYEDNGNVSEKQNVLVENIWDDLMSEGTYKSSSNGKVFFWEYQMTDPEEDTLTITTIIECPKPKYGLDLTNGVGKWCTYWRERIETYAENYEKRSTISPTSVEFGEYDYLNPATGEIEHKPARSVRRDDGLGDLSNLLYLF